MLQEGLVIGSSKIASCGCWQKRTRLSDLIQEGVPQHPWSSTLTLLLLLPMLVAPHERLTQLGKRKHTPPCSSAELFFAEKNGGHRGKISVVDMVFPGFHWVFVSTTDLEIFSLRPEKFPKRYSFGGGRVRFFFYSLHNGKGALPPRPKLVQRTSLQK